MKTAIIGGGICGLYLAKILAQKGNEVVVFEKKKTIGKECCSGLFSSRLFDFIPEAKFLSSNQINGCLINFPKRTIKLRFRQPFFTIEHDQLDLLMAGFAAQAGADIRLGETVDSAKLDKIVNDYDRVIGCDSALSIVRDRLCGCNDQIIAGLQRSDHCKMGWLQFWLGIQAFEKKSDNSDLVETWATKNGFLWKIPRGSDIEWGIMEKPNVARKLFDDFVAKKNLKLERLRSAIIPQGLAIPKNNKITLCGDASGLTKPWSGGGVIWNLTQANILLKNFPNFIQYRKEAIRFFSLRIFCGNLAKSLAYGAGFNFPHIIPQNLNLDGDFLFTRK
jgi:flavin-dependent dehydrogenase